MPCMKSLFALLTALLLGSAAGDALVQPSPSGPVQLIVPYPWPALTTLRKENADAPGPSATS